MAATLTFTPRQRETNLFGRIATVSYFIYLEESRISYLKELGVDVQEERYKLIVSSINCEFIKECGLDATLQVETAIEHIRADGFTVKQRMRNELTGELIANAVTEIVHIRNGEETAGVLPDSLVRMLISTIIEGDES